MQSVNERPPSLLVKPPLESSTVVAGVVVAFLAHSLIPVVLLASRWLLILLGLAVPVEERERPKLADNVIAAEFVRLGKPMDPRKLPSRKVPPVAKRKPEGVVVSKDAQEKPKPPEKKKEKPAEVQESLLDNLVDRSRDFAEDVEYEQEGDPEGLREGTATEAREGDLYRGKLVLFFRRNWLVPNVVRNPERLKAIANVEVDRKGRVRSVAIAQASGDPLFDQSVLDAVEALIQSGASIPEPPLELVNQFYDTTLPVQFRGTDAR